MSKLTKHLKTVHIHRSAVRKWCFKMGIPIQGLLHDLSKYSIKELTQCKYYTGKCSPHETMRKEFGYSTSWYHHRNRNKHHWEYWIDALAEKTAVKIPYKYIVEMVCDMAGASWAYNKKGWKTSSAYDYWKKNDGPHRIINPQSKALFEYLLFDLASSASKEDFFKHYKKIKKRLKFDYKNNKMLELV